MIYHGTIYNSTTGRIKSLVTTTTQINLTVWEIPTGFSLLQFKANNLQYINLTTKLPVDKQSLTVSWDKTSITADGLDIAILSGLPIPCTVFIDDIENEVSDGTLEFTADAVGEYQIRIDEVEYLPQEWTINAN